MNPTNDDIERIVREVIAQLRTVASQSVARSGTECNCAAQSVGQVPDDPNLSNSAVCTDRVITTSSLDGILEGARRLVVQNGAVITPAAKDLMRDRGVTWSTDREDRDDRAIGVTSSAPIDNPPTWRRLPAADLRQVARATRQGHSPGRDATTTTPSAMPLVVGASGCTMEQQAAVDSATAGRWSVERTELGDLLRVVEQVSSRIAGGNCRGFLLTDRTSVAVSLANGQRGVRAVVVCDPDGLRYAVDSARANLLVVNATLCDGPRIGALIDAYRQAKTCDCPTENTWPRAASLRPERPAAAGR